MIQNRIYDLFAKINQLCVTRVTLNSLTTDNLWPSDSRSNWNVEMLVFVEGGKPENPVKNSRSKDEEQQQTQLTYDVESGNRTRATLVGGKCSNLCAIPAPPIANSEFDGLQFKSVIHVRSTDPPTLFPFSKLGNFNSGPPEFVRVSLHTFYFK